MIGVLQGRLTLPTNGSLQCFPSATWDKEFALANECSLDCMELLFESIYNPFNPLFSQSGISELKYLSSEYGIAISSICDDHFMQKPPWGNDSNAALEGFKTLQILIEKCSDLGAKQLVLPFFDKADLKTPQDRLGLINSIENLLPTAKEFGVTLALELTLDAKTIKEILSPLKSNYVGVCFDTGNTTGKGLDAAKDILELGDLITHVHIKDRRRSDYANVLLGTGDAPFSKIFKSFESIEYSGAFILETFRDSDPIKTTKTHRNFILNSGLN